MSIQWSGQYINVHVHTFPYPHGCQLQTHSSSLHLSLSWKHVLFWCLFLPWTQCTGEVQWLPVDHSHPKLGQGHDESLTNITNKTNSLHSWSNNKQCNHLWAQPICAASYQGEIVMSLSSLAIHCLPQYLNTVLCSTKHSCRGAIAYIPLGLGDGLTEYTNRLTFPLGDSVNSAPACWWE